MVKFKDLFSFSKKEIDASFDSIQFVKKGSGFKILQGPRQGHGKLLVIASRKSGKAHKRNLFKRRVKAIFYSNNLYKKPLTTIILVYSQGLQLSFNKLQEFLLSCFNGPL